MGPATEVARQPGRPGNRGGPAGGASRFAGVFAGEGADVLVGTPKRLDADIDLVVVVLMTFFAQRQAGDGDGKRHQLQELQMVAGGIGGGRRGFGGHGVSPPDKRIRFQQRVSPAIVQSAGDHHTIMKPIFGP